MPEDRRYHLIDALRGLALVNMLGFHFLFDVNVVFGRDPGWYQRPGARVWQQAICCSFILIAGLSWHWGRRHNLRRGLLLSACGLLITAVTLALFPQEAVRFGILSFMGCAVLLTMALERGLKKTPEAWGLALCFALFLLFRSVNSGALGFGPWRVPLPAALYRYRVLAPLGFPDPLFSSADYFPLLPWYFLFLCGWFGERLLLRRERVRSALRRRIPLLSALGRGTIWIYLLHQPIFMGICYLIFR